MTPKIAHVNSSEILLQALRHKLDDIDNQLHDLLMRRAEVVAQVARDTKKNQVKIRPGREAAIIRRLIARNAGTLSPLTIARLWRELYAAALTIEGGQTMAVCADEAGEILALAREHFGALAPARRHRNPLQALADLLDGNAQVAVLPLPTEEPDSHWWTALMGKGTQRLHVIAKLPFWTRRAEGTPAGEAFAVAAIRPDASGDDRSLVALEFAADVSRARIASLLEKAGFDPGAIWLKRLAGEADMALVEVAGLIEEDDTRLLQITGVQTRPVVIGGFAVPLDMAA